MLRGWEALKQTCDEQRIAEACEGYAGGVAVGYRSEYMEKACDLDSMDACSRLSQDTRDPAKAAALAARVNALAACARAGQKPCNAPNWHGLIAGEQERVTHEQVDEAEARCRRNEKGACNELAGSYAKGTAFPKDLGRAAAIRASECGRGDAEACEAAADQYIEGAGVLRDPNRARDLHGRAVELARKALAASECGPGTNHELCEVFRQVASEQLSDLDRLKQAEIDPAPTVAACERGDVVACRMAAKASTDPNARARYDAKATAVVEQACGRGDPDSCAGLAYANDRTDPVKARQYYEAACRGGKLDSCEHLSAYLSRGTGGPTDPDRAYILKKRVLDDAEAKCATGSFEACMKVSVHYEEGFGVPKDAAKAKLFAQRATDAIQRAMPE